MQVVVCGSVAFDYILSAEGRFSSSISSKPEYMCGVMLINQVQRQFGGCAGNIAYGLSLLGVRGYPCATVGGNDFGTYTQWMQKNGIPDDYIAPTNGYATAQAYVVTDSQEDQIIFFHQGSMEQCHRQPVPETGKTVLGVIAPESRRGMLLHTKQMRDQKIDMLFSPGQGSSLFKKQELEFFIRNARWMICNHQELEIILSTLSLVKKDLIAMLDTLVVTRGVQGSTIFSGAEFWSIPTVAVDNPVDPTGCGDAYCAGIVYGLLHRLSWFQSGCLASLLGSLKCQVSGGQNYRFTRHELGKLFSHRFGETLPLQT